MASKQAGADSWRSQPDVLGWVARALLLAPEAALVAALEGLEVLLCEASPQVGGTAATSAGTLWIPGNRQSLAAGFSDSPEDVEGPNSMLRDRVSAANLQHFMKGGAK